MSRPPFRADHVGSYLRPERLRAARERFAAGHLPAQELHAIEDECIRDVVHAQENVGLNGITDGEFRRTFFHVDFLERLHGVEVRYGEFAAHFKKSDGTEVGFAPPTMHVDSKVKWVGPIQGPDFDFLKSVTTRTPKVCIPAPSMLHFRGGREAISEAVYPNLEDFYADLTAAYRAEIADLAARGLPLPAVRRHQSRLSLRSRHSRPHQGARRRSGRADPPLLPAHQRFDPRPAEGHDGLRPSLPRQFQERLGRAGRLRAGRRDPAQRDEDRRLLPRIRRRALRRLRAAALRAEERDRRARPHELEDRRRPSRRTRSSAASTRRRNTCRSSQCALSHQCGFSSTAHGNDLTEADQWIKLARMVEIAEEVWGKA